MSNATRIVRRAESKDKRQIMKAQSRLAKKTIRQVMFQEAHDKTAWRRFCAMWVRLGRRIVRDAENKAMYKWVAE